MKKIIFLLISLFSFYNVSFAAEVKIGFDESMKSSQKIPYDKGDIVSVAIYYDSKDFNLLAFLADLNYDKDKLEFLKYHEENGFTITHGEKILADRYGKDFLEKGKIATLDFKVKKYSDFTIRLKNITVADIEKELEVDDVTIEFVTKKNNNVIIISCGVLICGSIASILFYNLTKKQNKKKKK